MTARDWLADWLTRRAAVRLGQRYPDWALAVLSEHENIEDKDDRLGWALGVFRASLAVTKIDFFYLAILIFAVSAMTLYQWSADEGVATLLVLGGLSASLGFLRPRYFLLSGVVIGLVVTAVLGFESVSGIRPAYELYPRTLENCLHWLILVVPGLSGSAMGRQFRLKWFVRKTDDA